MHPTIVEIQLRTAEICGSSRGDILSDRRDGPTIRTRHIAMFAARLMTPQSLPAIGRAFNRDHTTVLHAIRKMDHMITRDQELYNDVQSVCRGARGKR